MSLLIQNARIADQASAYNGKTVDIFIEKNKISSIGNDLQVNANQTIDIKGKTLMPGWVSLMADYADPGYEHRETITSGLNSAKVGGFTDVILMPNTMPSLSSKVAIDYIMTAAKFHDVGVYPLGSLSKQIEGKEIAEMMEMRDAGAVAFTDGWKPMQHAGLLLKSLEYIKAFDGVAIQIPILAALSDGFMNESEMSVSLGMQSIPTIAETIILKRDIDLLRYTDSRIHFSGISTAESVQIIRDAKAEGLKVTCSVTPYHLLYTEADLATYNSLYKVNPPLRSEADRQALIAGLQDGTIDCIATQHKPHDWDEKVKEFEYTKFGMATQDVCYAMLVKANLGLSDTMLSKVLSTNIRSIFGLPTITVEAGADARFTIIDPTQSYKLSGDAIQTMAYNLPFKNENIVGRATTTL